MPDIGAVLRSVTTVNHFYPDLDAAFSRMFDTARRTKPRSWLMDLFRRVTIPGAYWTTHAWASVPVPGPAPRGQGIRDAGFDEFSYTLYPFDYHTPRLTWHIHDVRDSRAPRSLTAQAETAGNHLAAYPDLAINDVLTQTPSGVDGGLDNETDFTTIFGSAGVFNNSHTYNGQTLDNILSRTGLQVGQIANDLYEIYNLFMSMVDTEGQPYWLQESSESARWLIVIPKELKAVFDALFGQQLWLESGALSATSNWVRDIFGDKVTVKVLDRLSNTQDWYVFRVTENDGAKPFIFAEKDGVERDEWLKGQSDWSKSTLKEGMRWRRRMAFGAGEPFCCVKMGA